MHLKSISKFVWNISIQINLNLLNLNFKLTDNMESSSGTSAPSRGGKGKSALDKKPLGEVFGNKDVNFIL